MRTAIITIAGISSRFNEGISEEEKVLKAIYSKGRAEDTLLYHLLSKCSYADKIILVGGYKYDDLNTFYQEVLKIEFPQIELLKNDHYEDLASGYSLYLGIQKAFEFNTDELLFVEGDLDIDNKSFRSVVDAKKSVLTFTNEPIYANKAVVLYQDKDRHFKYAFSSSHGLLSINEPFSCILNSGQTWKFRDMVALRRANTAFGEAEIDGTNLRIIQRYIDAIPVDEIELVKLDRWTNCNTRDDYNIITYYWRNKN